MRVIFMGRYRDCIRNQLLVGKNTRKLLRHRLAPRECRSRHSFFEGFPFGPGQLLAASSAFHAESRKSTVAATLLRYDERLPENRRVEGGDRSRSLHSDWRQAVHG